jgi:hypothetical protein
MILALLLTINSANAWIENLYTEMSMDTYPYGVDPSPMLRTKSKHSVRIDSISDSSLYGRVWNKKYEWNDLGVCNCGDSTLDLEYNELFYNYPRRRIEE